MRSASKGKNPRRDQFPHLLSFWLSPHLIKSMEDHPHPPTPPPLRPPPSLPEEIEIEIASRLPFKSLLPLSSVSKSWKLFIKTLQPAMSGLFYKNRITGKIGFASIPSTSHAASVPIDTALTFLPPNLLPQLELSDCRNGLLLLASPNLDLICICNPATNKWAHIPAPPSATKKRQLLLAFDPRLSNHYHVVSIPYLHRGQVADYDGSELDVFSLATPEWATIKRFVGPIYRGITRFGFSGGILYYVDPITDDTFAVDVGGRVCWRVKSPVGSTDRIVQHCFGQSRGILHYATYTHLDRAMSVWVLENSSSNEYVLKHRNAYETVVGRRFDGLVNPDGMAFHPDSDVLFLSLQDELLAYHLISGKVEKICNLRRAGPLFPYSPYSSQDLEL